MTHSTVRIVTAFALAMLGALLFTGCTRDALSIDARQIEQQYGDVSCDELVRALAIVETRPAPQHGTKRSWEKEALIIGGSAGAGTAIGALAGGKNGAAVGAAAGGVGGLIYDLATRNKK